MAESTIKETNEGVAFTAKVVPGSSRTSLSGLLDGMLKVKISAPAEKGKANQCLIAFLARQIGVRKNDVTIVSGQTRPVKHIHVAGITKDALIRELDLDDLA